MFSNTYRAKQKTKDKLKNNEILWYEKYQETISYSSIDGRVNRFFFKRPKNLFVTPIEEIEFGESKKVI